MECQDQMQTFYCLVLKSGTTFHLRNKPTAAGLPLSWRKFAVVGRKYINIRPFLGPVVLLQNLAEGPKPEEGWEWSLCKAPGSIRHLHWLETMQSSSILLGRRAGV